MQVESLEVLEKADLSPAQARAIVRAIDIEIVGAKDTLATKPDIVELRSGMKALGAELRGELRAEVSRLATKAELHEAMSGLARQMYLAVLGQMAVVLGFTYF